MKIKKWLVSRPPLVRGFFISIFGFIIYLILGFLSGFFLNIPIMAPNIFLQIIPSAIFFSGLYAFFFNRLNKLKQKQKYAFYGFFWGLGLTATYILFALFIDEYFWLAVFFFSLPILIVSISIGWIIGKIKSSKNSAPSVQ
jgi:cation transport ATPase